MNPPVLVPLRVLLVEDSIDDAALIVDELRCAGFDPKWKRVEVEKDYRAGLREAPEIILSDFALPQFSTLRALALLQEEKLEIPFIIVSGTIGEESAVESLKSGATDYVQKDRLNRLGPAIRRALRESHERAERRKVEALLHLQNTALEAAANGIVITDRAGRILFANSAFCSLSGYRPEEVLGANPRFLKSGKHDTRFYRKLWETILDGRVWRGEIINQRKDGTPFQEEMTITPVRDTGGTITHFIAVKEDVTERKALQQELWLRDQRLNSFFSHATAGLCIVDSKLRFVQINETLAAMHGKTVAEHLGKTIREVLPKLAPVLEPIYRQVLGTGQPQLNIEVSGETSAEPGVIRHWIVSYFPVVSEREKPTAVGAVVVETTEQKRAQEALRESEGKFRELAENIDEVFWLADPVKPEVLYVSPAYEKISGRDCASVYRGARMWSEEVHPDDKDRVMEAVATKQAPGEYDEVFRIVRPNKEVRWIHDRAFPIRNAAGEIHRIVGVAKDITEEKALEQQFRQAQKMESIGQLAGGVAHDFNNILTIVQGHASLIEMSHNLSPQIAESVHEIAFAAEHAASLTRQLLTFSRRQVIQPGEVDLNEVVGGVAKMLRRTLGEDITLQFESSAELPPIWADAGMMEQILMNLAVNARDAMPKGGCLTVRTTRLNVDEAFTRHNLEASMGTFACLTVSDTGSGIAPENLSKIFEPFFTTKEVGKGTGLGLATVYGIVKQHRGWIDVQSQPGKGTTFTIYLPAEKERKGGKKSAAPKEIIRGGKETILLVEDETALRMLVRNVLESYGYKIMEAECGPAALDVWREHHSKVNLLLTDLVMPGGMTGRDLAEQLRKQKPGLRVVYTSGYSAEIVGKDFRLREGLNFLQKPYPPRKLAKCVRDCLDSSRAE
jgi:PAS domain S-box-containing protein